MFYKSHIKPIILALSVIIGILVCAFGTVVAQEESEKCGGNRGYERG